MLVHCVRKLKHFQLTSSDTNVDFQIFIFCIHFHVARLFNLCNFFGSSNCTMWFSSGSEGKKQLKYFQHLWKSKWYSPLLQTQYDNFMVLQFIYIHLLLSAPQCFRINILIIYMFTYDCEHGRKYIFEDCTKQC